MSRNLSLILGIILAAGAFVGVLFLGAVANPSPYKVVVVIRTVQPGEVLTRDMVGIDAQRVSPRVAEEYVLEKDLPRYLGGTVIRVLLPGQPLMHGDVVHKDSPAARRRIALALEDPERVAMVIPVDGNAPDGILPGDRVAVIWSIGEIFGFGTPETEGMFPSSPEATPAPGEAGRGTQPPPASLAGLPPEVVSLLAGGGMENQEIAPPLAKQLVSVVDVAYVRRKNVPNPAYTGQQGERPYIEGGIEALEVIARRDDAEAIQFAIDNGHYSIVVLSPNATEGDLTQPSFGVTWGDVKAFIQAERMKAMGRLNVEEALSPAGAAERYAPLMNPLAFLTGTLPLPIPPVTPGGAGTGEGSGEGIGPEGAATAVPTPMPTATPLPRGTPTPAPTPPPAVLPSGFRSILIGGLCGVGILLIGAIALKIVLSLFRKRG